MSKDKSAMVPKAWAAFSDALDEASTEAARQIIDRLQERLDSMEDGEPIKGVLDSIPIYAEVADIVTKAVRDSIGERFTFVEPEVE